jgi:hypothetical protein
MSKWKQVFSIFWCYQKNNLNLLQPTSRKCKYGITLDAASGGLVLKSSNILKNMIQQYESL